MASARSPKKWWHLFARKKQQAGFTLIELLVAILVGGIIAAILLALVVTLLETNQREASRSDTQREVQMALDYISRDLREAVYVYDGSCLVSDEFGSFQGLQRDCRGLLGGEQPALPAEVTNAVPVLAFWKPEKLPKSLQDTCVSLAAELSKLPAQQSQRIQNVPCVSGRMYSLIVYTLVENPAADPKWRGKARIMRYRLPQFTTGTGSGTANVAPPVTNGWTYPLADSVGFENWPRDKKGDDMRANRTPAGDNQVLLDYVDFDGPKDGAGQPVFDEGKLCPSPQPSIIPGVAPDPGTYQGGYVLTPNATVSRGKRGFFVCVNGSESYGKINQEVVVRINGNAAGRPGIPRDRDVPLQLETLVLTRGVVNKNL